MRIVLEKVTVTRIEVEMPEACPHCGEPWQNAVLEDQMVQANQDSYDWDKKEAEAGAVGIGFRDHGSGDTFWDSGLIVTGYTCAHCLSPIVSSDDVDEEETKPQETIQGV